VSVGRGPDVATVRSLTELCGLQIKMETYKAPRDPRNANAASVSDTSSATVFTHPDAWHAATPTHP